MRTTRSASRAAAGAATTPQPSSVPIKEATPSKKPAGRVTKRKAPATESKAANVPESGTAMPAQSPKKRAKKLEAESSNAPQANSDAHAEAGVTPVLLPAKLTFSFDDAKKHLIEEDARFEDVFRRLPCKPFEKLERVEPFRTLTTSILGQQISWLAARSINHRFVRLYFPDLPEKPDAEYWAKAPITLFPTPHQVAATDLNTLRTAGLSGRKAEYVQDLAARFADGRLSAEKLFEADDEELYELLTAVRGIGRWTVDMFAIFSLRRPDIMPYGDLGVQRGVMRWFLSLHSTTYRIDISPQKLPKSPNENPKEPNDKATPVTPAMAATPANEQSTQVIDEDDALPTVGQQTSTRKTRGKKAVTQSQTSSGLPAPTPVPLAAASTLNLDAATPVKPPIGGIDTETPSQLLGPGLGLPSMPPQFTPSINATLEGSSNGGFANATDAKGEANGKTEKRPLPEGLTVGGLKGRLDGKKKIKGAFLTPKEMEELTEGWKPYRSLGVYYMWALSEEK